MAVKSAKGIDPALESLFSKTLDLKYVGTGASNSRRDTPTKVNARRYSNQIKNSEGNQILALPQDVAAQPGLKPHTQDQHARAPRQRKRKKVDDDLESNYMQRLAKREKTVNSSDREDEVTKKQRPKSEQKHPGPGDYSSALDTEDAPSEASDELRSGSHDIAVSTLQHESLAPSQEAIELEKASRTIFLANVSTAAIKSKSSKRTLTEHLTSFISDLPEHKPPHKLDSLRFRSTAFAHSAVPKKAAFAKKELMDATTKSTNAYAVYNTTLAAREAASRLNGTVILERHLRVDNVAHPARVDNQRCVFVGNLGFVDDETAIRAAEDKENDQKPRRPKTPADVEEGLWRQFSKAGAVESVRVIRDKTTRVGKGIAYVQFKDANAVEKALLYNDKKFPPLLPRSLRVTRAKNIRKTASYGALDSMPTKKRRAASNGIYNAKSSSQAQSLSGRAGKLLGRAGAAQLKGDQGPGTSRSSSKGGKIPRPMVFEGHRAMKSSSTGSLQLGRSRKKQGRPENRGSKRAAAFRASGGKKSRNS